MCNGPSCGYAVGAILVTKVGGYISKKAIIICLVFSGISTTFAMIIVVSKSIVYYLIITWIYLFATGVMVPLKTGIIISSLPERLRCDWYTITNFLLNVIGNLPATFVYGAIYEKAKYSMPVFALLITMATNIIGFAFIIIATIYRWKKKDIEDVKENDIEVIKEE